MEDIGYKDDFLTFNAKCPNCGRLHIKRKLAPYELTPVTIEDLFCSQMCSYNFKKK